MFLLDSLITLFTLRWSQAPLIRPLPAHIERTYITTAVGKLEVLSAIPDRPVTAPPILFVHGGYGSASVYLEWMTYLRTRYPGKLYAISLRNHGGSYTLPYLAMLRTSFESLQKDLLAVLDTIDTPILVGHSSGGGLVQAVLANGAKARGLCLVGAIPSFGSYDIYANWCMQDPWFPLRSMFHLQHPTSPLSTDALVHGAFFGHKFPMSRVGEFRRWMPAYESMGWPWAMVGRLSSWIQGKNEWLDCKEIVRGIEGKGDKVCVMIGEEDMMYREWMWERQCEEYRVAIGEQTELSKADNDVVTEEAEGCVRLVLVKDSGHHVQNDVHWKQAADALLRWAEQV